MLRKYISQQNKYEEDRALLAVLGIDYTPADYDAYNAEQEKDGLELKSLRFCIGFLHHLSWLSYQKIAHTVPGEKTVSIDQEKFEEERAGDILDVDLHLAAMNRVLKTDLWMRTGFCPERDSKGHGLSVCTIISNPKTRNRAESRENYRKPWRKLPQKNADSVINGAKQFGVQLFTSATTSSFMLPPPLRNNYDAKTTGLATVEKQSVMRGNENAGISGYLLGKVLQYGVIMPCLMMSHVHIVAPFTGAMIISLVQSKKRAAVMKEFKDHAASMHDQKAIAEKENESYFVGECAVRLAGFALAIKFSTLMAGDIPKYHQKEPEANPLQSITTPVIARPQPKAVAYQL